MQKQKNFLLLCLYLLIIISCMGCKKDAKKSETLVSLAENGIEKVEAPQGCEIISNPADFTPVTEDQSYHFETDTLNYQTACGLADASTKMFYMVVGYLYYYDKEQNKCDLLCNRPDCTHVTEEVDTCSAYIDSGQGLAYAEGALYTVSSKKIELIKVSLDGTEHTVIGNLCKVPEEDIVTRDHGSYSMIWLIHRGYIYYYYRLYAGMTEDIYYLNGSNCLYRMPIDGSGDPECILPFVCEGESAYTILKGYGSYIYMNVAEKEKKSGYLYRYNIESGKVEKLETLGDDIRGHMVKNGTIYYSNMSEPEKIYCYDESIGEVQLFLDIKEDEKYQWHSCLYSDNDYIYVPCTEEEGVKDGMFMFDGQGKTIAYIPWINSKEGQVSIIDDFCGISDGRLYFLRNKIGEYSPWIQTDDFYAIPYYIKKTDLADGAYEIHEAEK